MIKVKVLTEAGYEQALYGMALSHSLEVGPELTERKVKRAAKLAHMQGGHNKFLESVYVWLEVTAPRYWWQQADTYRVSTKQSESTMHTLRKSGVRADMFVVGPPKELLDILNLCLAGGHLDAAKALLPEGFLQKRVWCLSYKTLQNMYYQRRKHRLQEWPDFLEQTLAQLEHPEFVREA